MTKATAYSILRVRQALVQIETLAKEDARTGRFSAARKKHAENAWDTLRCHLPKLGVETPQRSVYYDLADDLKRIAPLQERFR